MPSPADHPTRDPGLAAERTALSWQRMALSFTSLAAVILAAAAHRHRPWLLVPAAGVFLLGAGIWLYSRRRIAAPATPTARGPLVLLAAAAIAAALVAGVLAAIPVS
jgi:uncharacterized membrane protein YidH (DUF202 family)